MTVHRALDEGALHKLLSTIRDTSWSWQEQDLPGLVARFGWGGLEFLPGLGAVVDPGYGFGSRACRLSFGDGGRVKKITVRISSKALRDDLPGQLFLADVFADALVVATWIMGAPTTRTPGPQPEVSWRGAESTSVLELRPSSVELAWAGRASQDQRDSSDLG